MQEEEYLAISGIQHFVFCQRQWALIHIERLWEENLLTVEGRFLHERVDNPFELEKRGELVIARSVPLISKQLMMSGVADAIEYRMVEQGGVPLPGRSGLWVPHPVEYKHGRPKKDECDIAQLCVQAICLEEMLKVRVDFGELFYGEIRRRQKIPLDTEMRNRVNDMAAEMHALFQTGRTPPAVSGPNCRRCSLVDVCMPKLTKKKRSVRRYVHDQLSEIGI